MSWLEGASALSSAALITRPHERAQVTISLNNPTIAHYDHKNGWLTALLCIALPGEKLKGGDLGTVYFGTFPTLHLLGTKNSFLVPKCGSHQVWSNKIL